MKLSYSPLLRIVPCCLETILSLHGRLLAALSLDLRHSCVISCVLHSSKFVFPSKCAASTSTGKECSQNHKNPSCAFAAVSQKVLIPSFDSNCSLPIFLFFQHCPIPIPHQFCLAQNSLLLIFLLNFHSCSFRPEFPSLRSLP